MCHYLLILGEPVTVSRILLGLIPVSLFQVSLLYIQLPLVHDYVEIKELLKLHMFKTGLGQNCSSFVAELNKQHHHHLPGYLNPSFSFSLQVYTYLQTFTELLLRSRLDAQYTTVNKVPASSNLLSNGGRETVSDL